MISTRLDTEDNILLQIVTGQMMLSDFVTAVNRRFQHPAFDTHLPVLWDLTQADWMGAHQEFGFVSDEISNWIRSHRPLGPVAAVFASVTDQALFNTFYSPSQWMNFQTFTSIPEAREWLLSHPSPSG